ncbi:hypothetical protein OA264_01420 [Alphaproteobacteria bacterium]|nr:hypothetical protein [Alphaproteobacteria bacterium]
MPEIKSSFNLKAVCIFFLILNFIVTLGFFNSSWTSLIAWMILFLCIYSGKILSEKKKWILIICITLCSLCIKNFIKTPFILEGSNVFIGGDFEQSIFKEKLPPIIFKHLNDDFVKKFPENISAPAPYLFDKGVSQIINKNNESRYVKKINWKNRYSFQQSAFNNTKYNSYGQQQPKRELLPFFVKYTFPENFKNKDSKLCWKGQAYIKLDVYKSINHLVNKCIFINDFYYKNSKSFTVWFIETGASQKLSVSFFPSHEIMFKNFFKDYMQFFLALLICFIAFNNFKKFNLIFFGFSFIFSVLLMYYFQPSVLDKFLLFEGGNDGLLYVHFAHLIVDNLVSNNYVEAFRGGESAYDLMPFYRYVWVINYILFEESPWLIFFIITLLPLVIFSIFKDLLGKSWAIIIISFWFFFPLFEAFGFFHFYYVKLSMRGFAEPLSNLLFLSSIAMIIKIFKTKDSKLINENTFFFFLGMLLSFSLGLRANILPAFLVLVLFIFIFMILKKKFKAIIFFGLGLMPCLIMPIHNYYFTKKFIPLTIAAYKDWNLGAKPVDYLMLVLSIIKINFDFGLWKKITSHISGEIKIYELWYHITIFSNIYIAFSKKSKLVIRLISWSSLAMLLLILFYHVGGRYSYLTWTLSLIVFLYFLKNNLFPFFKRMKGIHAS